MDEQLLARELCLHCTLATLNKDVHDARVRSHGILLGQVPPTDAGRVPIGTLLGWASVGVLASAIVTEKSRSFRADACEDSDQSVSDRDGGGLAAVPSAQFRKQIGDM